MPRQPLLKGFPADDEFRVGSNEGLPKDNVFRIGSNEGLYADNEFHPSPFVLVISDMPSEKPMVFCHYYYICKVMRLIQRNMAQIAALCEKHKFLQLYVFGSVLTDKFNNDSDVDFTVIFDREQFPLLIYGENYFDFKFALEDLLERDVELVEYNAAKNPYFNEELDETKQLIYGQAS